MTNDTFTFSISTLMDKPMATSENYSFDAPAEFEEIKTDSSINGKVEVMKIDEGFNVITSDVEVDVVFECERCLIEFNEKIRIPHAERQFYFSEPKKIEDIADLFLIDKKRQKIDLSDMLRQEIALHFPVNQVCSDGCKGLCQICGKNNNENSCDCNSDEISEHKPLAGLKDLLK